MSKRIDLITFSGNNAVIWDTSGFDFTTVNIFCHSGTFGGGTLQVSAGIKGSTSRVKITSKISAAVHNNLDITAVGNIVIDCICDEMLFFLGGSVSPTFTLSVYPEPSR